MLIFSEAGQWEQIESHIFDDDRVDVYVSLIELFESFDMDCYESIEENPIGAQALKILHPEWYKDD